MKMTVAITGVYLMCAITMFHTTRPQSVIIPVPISGKTNESLVDTHENSIIQVTESTGQQTQTTPSANAHQNISNPLTPVGLTPQPKYDSTLELFTSQQNLLNCITSGMWLEQSYTKSQESEMLTFLNKTRTQYGLPYPLQREDGMCGNIAFSNGKLVWFRAVCDPHFETPCCFEGKCMNKSVEECKCENCFDLRPRLYAEYSNWKNNNGGCQVSTFTPTESCSTLDGATVVVIGDSHMRHMYMGVQILLTGDHELGCMSQQMPEELKKECHGMYMFTEKVCRTRVISSQQICEGRVNVQLHELFSSKYADRIVNVTRELIGKPGTLLVIGLGHHDSFNPSVVIPETARPVVELLKNSGEIWPKLIWVGAHSLGVLKTPVVPSHANPSAIRLNKALTPFFQSTRINFLNPFNLTKGIMSPDGSHFGMGANLLKARVLLDFIKRVGGVSSIATYPK